MVGACSLSISKSGCPRQRRILLNKLITGRSIPTQRKLNIERLTHGLLPGAMSPYPPQFSAGHVSECHGRSGSRRRGVLRYWSGRRRGRGCVLRYWSGGGRCRRGRSGRCVGWPFSISGIGRRRLWRLRRFRGRGICGRGCNCRGWRGLRSQTLSGLFNGFTV